MASPSRAKIYLNTQKNPFFFNGYVIKQLLLAVYNAGYLNNDDFNEHIELISIQLQSNYIKIIYIITLNLINNMIQYD